MKQNRPSDSRRTDGRERGVILLLTLFIVALLCVIVLEFSYTTRVEYHVASMRRDELLALSIARAGVYKTVALLREDRLKEIEEKEAEEGKDSSSGGEKEKEKDGKDQQAAEASEEVEYPDHYGEDWAMELIDEPLGEGFLSLRVIDESGKININSLVKEEQEVTSGDAAQPQQEEQKAEEKKKGDEPEEEEAGEETEKIKPFRKWGQKDADKTGEESEAEAEGEKEEGDEPLEEEPTRYVVDKKVEKDIMRLIEELDVRRIDTEEVTAAIIDWMDSDDEGDFEDDAYDDDRSPPKNAPLDLLSELLMVEGVTGDLYFGPKQPESLEIEGKARAAKKRKRNNVGLRDCLTAFSKTKVNVNTAPPEVLAALIEEENDALVREIAGYTKKDHFEDLSQFEEEIGEHIPAGFRAKIGVGSDTFQIISEGRVNEAVKRIRAYVQRDDNANIRTLLWRVED